MKERQDPRTGGRHAHPGDFRGFLAPVADGVPPDLISASAFENIFAVARWIPEPLALNTFGFECRLGGSTPRADFLVLATAAQGRESLVALDDHPAALAVHPVWRSVRDFAAL